MKKVCLLIIGWAAMVIPFPTNGQHSLEQSGDREVEQGNHNSAISYYLDALGKFPK